MRASRSPDVNGMEAGGRVYPAGQPAYRTIRLPPPSVPPASYPLESRIRKVSPAPEGLLSTTSTVNVNPEALFTVQVPWIVARFPETATEVIDWLCTFRLPARS